MKKTLIILIAFISTQSFSKPEERNVKGTHHQEGLIYYFDMREHSCGQMYYIKIKNDTIKVNDLLNLKLNHNELPLEVYLAISGFEDDRCGAKILNHIKRK